MSTTDALQIVIVGASAAGLRAASRARRLNPRAKVVVLDKEEMISYGACGMPYFVSGDIERADKLRMTPYGRIRDPDYFHDAKDIEVRTGVNVTGIDCKAHKVFCEQLKTGDALEWTYDKLVLATGAQPIMIPGVAQDSRRITTFKTLPQAIELKKQLERGEISKVGIIGGGFIGCEMAEAFGSLWGAEVVMIEGAPTILPTLLDKEIARSVEAYLKGNGVEIQTGCFVETLNETKNSVTIETPKGAFEVDCVVVAVGVKPANHLAKKCGLKVGASGGITVDERMQTSDPDIFAAGDCVEVKHLVSGNTFSLPLGSLANRQGRVVGSNLGGGLARFGPVVGSACVKIFDLNVASTGLTEEAARNAGIDVESAWGSFTDRAEYYPDAQNIFLKLVLEKNTLRLIGLQGYGPGEVVKRVDVFSALLKKDATLEDLLDMEFAYAPPYAPALDPLFALSCAAMNALKEGVSYLPPDADLTGKAVIDVREPGEVEAKPFDPEAKNISFEEVRKKLNEVPSDRPILVVCSKGLRSSESARMLLESGLTDVVYLGGGSLMRPS